MTLTKQIAEIAKSRAGALTVADLCVGVGYTGVKLSDGSGGVCYTFRNALGPTCGVLKNAGSLIGLPAQEVLDWADESNLAQAAVGVAAINAILNQRFEAGANIVQAVSCTDEQVVGMVGDFCPLVGKFQNAKELYIFDREAEKRPGRQVILPEEKEEELLPQCDLVVLTGTSFINKTADHVLDLCRHAKEIIIVGASTPMCPEVLGGCGVTALAGTRITDADAALRIVAQGGGGMDFSRVSLKLFERIAP